MEVVALLGASLKSALEARVGTTFRDSHDLRDVTGRSHPYRWRNSTAPTVSAMVELGSACADQSLGSNALLRCYWRGFARSPSYLGGYDSPTVIGFHINICVPTLPWRAVLAIKDSLRLD